MGLPPFNNRYGPRRPPRLPHIELFERRLAHIELLNGGKPILNYLNGSQPKSNANRQNRPKIDVTLIFKLFPYAHVCLYVVDTINRLCALCWSWVYAAYACVVHSCIV